MHGALPAKARRQTRLLAVLAAGLAVLAAGLVLAVPARAATGTGGLSVTIDSMSPQYAAPGGTVTLSGTVTNGTRRTQLALDVQLYSSPAHFTTRDQMDSFLAHGANAALEPAGKPAALPASVPPGATVTWRASFQVSAQGISAFGVYPVTAQLQDSSGGVLSAEPTLLPFWPGQRAAGLARPLKISWLWPLIDQPHRQVCASLVNNDLAAELRPGGRLAGLLSAGTSHEDAGLTWVIDPALLSEAATMSSRYQVGARPDCTGATYEPASRSAARWLAGLREVTKEQPALVTPYANVDMSALVHQGLTGDLASAYATGQTVADRVLHGQFGHAVAWPPGGTADLSVLTDLAATENVRTVVLDSSEMPPANAATTFQPDDAVTSLRVAGLPMTVLLSDHTLTQVLAAGSAARSAGAQFAVRQRFLAETAMIAAEAPNTARTIVVAPPQEWSPPQALAGGLLSETAAAPWLQPAPLRSLSSAPDTQRGVQRQPPPAGNASPGELSRGYLSQVRAVSAQLATYKSVLYKADPGYLLSLNQALAATESAAWRGGRAASGKAMADSLSDYLSTAWRKIKIIASAQVPMGGTSGQVPVSIQNGLLQQSIRVRITVSVANSPDQASQLTIGQFQSLVVIPAEQTPTIRLPVTSAPPGSTLIELSLTSADGSPIPVATAKINVQSTRYGRAILVLIAVAIGILVLSSAYRGVRRWLHGDGHLVNEETGPPGSVDTGISGARHPTEAPDDLADARRRADDT